MLQVSLTVSTDKDLSPGWGQNSLCVRFHFYVFSLSRAAGFLAAVPSLQKVHGLWAAPKSLFHVLQHGRQEHILPAHGMLSLHTAWKVRLKLQKSCASAKSQILHLLQGAASGETAASCKRSGICGCCSSSGPPLPWVWIPDKPRGSTQE